MNDEQEAFGNETSTAHTGFKNGVASCLVYQKKRGKHKIGLVHFLSNGFLHGTPWIDSISCVRVCLSWTLIKIKSMEHLCFMDNQMNLNDRSSLPKTHKQKFWFTNTHIQYRVVKNPIISHRNKEHLLI